MIKRIKINEQAVRDACERKGFSMMGVSEKLDRSSSYLGWVLNGHGGMAYSDFCLLCTVLGVKAEELMAKEPAPKTEPKPAPSTGYSLHLDVRPTVCTVSLLFDGKAEYIGRSRIKGDSKLDLCQAISYATHMIYKAAGQDALQEEVNNA